MRNAPSSNSLRRIAGLAAAVALATGLAACGDTAKLPFEAGVGPSPELPAPKKTLIPTLNIAPALGWQDTAGPTAAAGMRVTALARGLEHPRWVYVLPNGDVLVAESAAPPKPDDHKPGIRGRVQAMFMKRAGSVVPSADRITLLRDADGDGVAEVRTVFLDKAAGLMSPFGMALVGNNLYVANADAVVRFPYNEGDTRINANAAKVTDLPAGINHHWTKNLIASADGAKLYVTVGSNSNAAENGMEIEEGRAAIWELDPATGNKRLFATGLRNPNGMGWEPQTGVLWTVVNERDEIGSDLVPDYLTSVQDGAFYGWPYSYFGQHVDTRVEPQKPELVAKALVPDYALGNHVAPLGMAFAGSVPRAVGAGAAASAAAPAAAAAGTPEPAPGSEAAAGLPATSAAPAATAPPAPSALPAQFASGAFIGQHGSWNRKPHSGYNVVFVPFANGKPSGQPVDVLTGFLSADGKALGRPVGVAIDKRGALLVADDVGNAVWHVSAGVR